MNSLITYKGEMPLLDAETASKLVEFERMIKSIKEQEDALRAAILASMEESGIIKLTADDLTINYISATDKEVFNAKQFREDNPDLYDEYVTMRPVKASIRITVKENKS